MAKLVAFIVFGAVGWLVSAWGDMLIVGVVHRDWWPLVPTMSYHVALILAAVLMVFLFGIGIAGNLVKVLFDD